MITADRFEITARFRPSMALQVFDRKAQAFVPDESLTGYARHVRCSFATVASVRRRFNMIEKASFGIGLKEISWTRIRGKDVK